MTCSGPTQCVNIEGSYHCGCNAGYSTDAACVQCIEDGKLVFPPDSNPNLCVAESDGDCCSNINECADPALNLCPPDSDCIDNDGSFFCDCHDFAKFINEEINVNTNLWVCVDKDECSDPAWNNCDPNSVCINTHLSYYCACNEGWENCADLNVEPEGSCCQDVDECDPPHPFACDQTYGVCSNKPGWYTCECQHGFVGDGFDPEFLYVIFEIIFIYSYHD